MFPSVKTIQDRLGVDRAKATRIRGLMDGSHPTKSYESVKARIRECYNPPSRLDRTLTALNEELDTFGAECITDDRKGDHNNGNVVAEYLNTGDTYSITIIYDHARDLWQVLDYGTWLERYERRVGNQLA